MQYFKKININKASRIKNNNPNKTTNFLFNFKIFNIMRKLFLFIAAALVSTSMWAAATTLFSMETKTSGSDFKAGTTETEITTSNYLSSISGGTLHMAVISGSAQKVFGADNSEYHMRLASNAAYAKITMSDNTFAEGDSIIITKGNADNQPCITSIKTRSTDTTTTNFKYVIPKGSPLIDKSVVYLWKASSNVYIKAISIIRPDNCIKPGTPTSLSAGDITYKSASLSWAEAENSDGYQISIIKKSDSSVKLDWTDCATNSYAATGLDAETTYTFKVKAKGADGYCELGDEAKADFTTIVAPEICPSGLTITGTKEYMEHDNISLTATLTEGTGAITYQWYKGSIDVENALEGKTSATLTIENCAQSDAGNYYCVASKTECPDAESAVCAVTVSEYECPTSGTVLSLAMKSGLSPENVPHGTYIEMTSTYATVSGGVVKLGNSHSSDDTKAMIHESKMYLGGNNGYVLVELTCPLKEDDEISFTGDEDQICFTLAASRSTTYSSSSNSFKVSSAFLNGNDDVTTFYIWRVESAATYIQTLTITRPSPATSIENQESKIDNRKFIKDGQLFIEKNGHVYNVFGTCIK